MPIDPSIALGYKPIQVDSPVNQLAKVLQIQGMQDESRMNQLKTAEYQRTTGETNKLNDLYRTSVGADGTVDRNALYQGAAQQGLGSRIPGLQKGFLETDKAQAEVDKEKLAMAKQRTELTGQAAGWLRQNPTPENASAMIDHLTQNQVIPPQMAVQMKQQLAANPGSVPQLADMMFRTSLATKDQLAKYETRNTGGATDTLQIDPVTGKAAVVNSVKNTQSPDSIASNATSVANNKRTIEGENMRAGVSADGSVSPDVEAQAQAIAKGQLLPPSGAALINPKNAKVLARVMEINPTYDATTVLAKKKAAADFTSGSLGNALRSVSTANAHLDQLGELADALQNGNTEVINKVGNYFSKQTGNPAVTNFDAIKNIVGQEVVKAIVAGGGGVGEREEAAKIFSSANSPAQLKGAIQHYRMVMGAQANNLMEQRRAAGLPDSTLPNYAGTNTTPAAPATAGAAPKGWTYIGTTK